MKPALVLVAFLVLTAPAFADAEDDLRVCRDQRIAGAERIEPCTRLIDAGGRDATEMSNILLGRANAYLGIDDIEAALADHAAAVALTPDRPQVYSNRATTLMAVRRYDEALPDLERAIALDPASDFYRNRLGVALYNLDRNDEALAAFDVALELNPRSDNSLFYRGHIHLAAGRLDLALADFGEGAALFPFDPDFRVGLGRAYQEQGDIDGAVREYRLALLLDRNLLEISFRLDDIDPAPAVDITDRLAYAPPANGLRVTYLEVLNPSDEEDILGDLIAFFAGPDYPPPIWMDAVRRDIGPTVDGATPVTVTTALFGREPVAETSDVIRILWPLRPPAGSGPPIVIAYDETIEAFWSMAPGETTTGSGNLMIGCPATPNPMFALLGCTEGVDAARVGGLTWSATFEGWESLLVPAGRRLAARVAFSETRELTLFGQTATSVVESKYWLDPVLHWWIRRDEYRETETLTAEAWIIEAPGAE